VVTPLRLLPFPLPHIISPTDCLRYSIPVDFALSAVQARALGALIEKDITTPDYYPLSLNALVNACNQKNNRDPVMTLDEDAVRDALSGLHDLGLAGPASGADSRVTKYEHRLQEAFNFTRAETAVLCVLFLRGPQTPGELRGRTERMYRFEELSDVLSTLQRLSQRDQPLVKQLARQPGTKEARFAHLFSGDVPSFEPSTGSPIERPSDESRMAQVADELRTIRREIEDLKGQFAAFRKQFE
jgi:uncharacterized protein